MDEECLPHEEVAISPWLGADRANIRFPGGPKRAKRRRDVGAHDNQMLHTTKQGKGRIAWLITGSRSRVGHM